MTKNKSHILFIASWYPSRSQQALGNFIQRHAQAAALHNTISVVYASAEKSLTENTIEIAEDHSGSLSEYVVYYGKIKSALPVLGKLKKRDAYKNAVRKGVDAAIKKNGKPDLIHVHVIWPAALVALPLLEELKVPLLITEHWSGYLPEDGNYKGIILKNFSRQLADKAEHITVVSSRMEEAMKQRGLGKSFSILPNTIDTGIFKLKPKQIDTTSFKLLHVSMLVDREKNISGLLRVIKKMEAHPEISLEIIGDGPEKSQHEELAAQLGLLNKTVFFSGLKSPTEIAAAMNASDALIMFSHFEGMPVTIIEAQSCGLPVIATRTGNIPQMVNDSNGILVAPGDENALADAILHVKENRDKYNSETISRTASEKHSMQAVGKIMDELYNSILTKNAR